MTTLDLNVYRPDGTLVGSRPVPGLAAGARSWDWDGRVDGAIVPDGSVILQLAGTAGSAAYHAPSGSPATPSQVSAYAVTIDTVPPLITAASISTALISPNGDGILDGVRLSVASTGSTRWSMLVTDAGGTAVRTMAGAGSSAGATWNGTNDSGQRVPDGRYTVSLGAADDGGNATVRSFQVTVDTAGPVIATTARPGSFSPDGDGIADRTSLALTSSEAATGVAQILKGTAVIRSWPVTSRTTWSASWDGRSTRGVPVADGSYRYRVTVKDAAGNRTVVDAPVMVDRTIGWLRWSGNFHPQDGDAIRATSAVGFRLARAARVTLRILDARGAVVRSVWSGRALGAGTKAWTWNGRDNRGAYAPQGLYTAELTATSSLGTTRLTRPVWASAFAARASAPTVVPGQTLTVLFSTVEPLRTRPVATFSQPGQAPVAITATRLADGTYRAAFAVRAGPPGIATVVIRATDTGRHLNSTTISVAVGL